MTSPPRDSVQCMIPLARISLSIALSAAEKLAGALELCRRSVSVPAADVEETIIQSIPYSGFPGAVEAFGAWRRLAPGEPAEADDPVGGEGTMANGLELFQRIYGDRSDKVRQQLRGSHPHLEQLVLEIAYGRIMGRRRFCLGDLEALATASLLGQRRRAPLHSHLRGALRNGWSTAALHALLDDLAPDCNDEMIRFARVTLAAEGSAGDSPAAETESGLNP